MTKSTTPDVVLTSEQIAGLLPHRYPFALVDRVIAHEPGVSATAIKNVTMNEPQFQGHFPERPLMPGVLIVEAMAQVGGLIVTQMPDLPKGLFVFAGIDGVRFRRPVVPGDQLVIRCELLSLKRKRFGKVTSVWVARNPAGFAFVTYEDQRDAEEDDYHHSDVDMMDADTETD